MSDSNRQLFLRFRDHGDVAALGELFDGVAVELFKLALFLAPDASDAEDLVQGTFLTAIESAQGYDDTRPLKPWLTGILANLARRRRRDRGRADRNDVPEGLEVMVEADSAGAAERAEIRECYAEAMRGLPQPYKQVLTLHLEEGMTARRIGEVLERPAGTVRSQVVRGLEILRKAMPASVAGALAGMLTTGHALAGVRVEVLQAAGRWSAASAAVTGVSVGVRSLLIRVAAVAISAVVVAGLWGRASQPVPEPGGAPATAQQAAVSSSHDVPQRGDSSGAGPSGATGPERAAVAEKCSIDVQLVDAAGKPQGGLMCRLVAEGDRSELFAIRCLRDPSAAVRSDADGHVRFEVATGGVYDLWIVGSRARRKFVLPDPKAAAGTAWKLPDVQAVEGRVVGPDGAALAGVDVYASPSLGTMDAPRALSQSAEDGRFSFLLASRPAFVWIEGSGYRSDAVPVTGGPMVVNAYAAPGRVDVEVVAADGRPVAGAIVAGYPASPSGNLCPVVFTKTDEGGRVQLVGLPTGDFLVAARHGDRNADRARIEVPAGAAPKVRLQLRDGAEVCGRVVDSKGAPMRGIAVFGQVPPLRADSFDGRIYGRITWTDDDGNYTMPGLPAGDVRLRLVRWGARTEEIVMRAERFAVGERRRLDWKVEQTQLRGRVVGVPAGQDYVATVAPVDMNGRVQPTSRFVEPVPADGEFEILVPPRFRSVAVYVGPQGASAPLVGYCARTVVRDLSMPVEITLDEFEHPVATLCAQLPEPVDRGAEVALVRRAINTIEAVGDDGAVRFDQLGVGDYTLRVTRRDGFIWTRDVSVPGDRVVVDLGRLAADVVGILIVQGSGNPDLQLCDAGMCFLRRIGLNEPIAVEAGSYQLIVRGADTMPRVERVDVAGGGRTVHRLRVLGGARCDFTFSFDPADNPLDTGSELSVNVLARSGELVVGHRITSPQGGAYRWTQKIAPGRYRVEAVAAWGGAVTAELVVAGAGPVVFERRLVVR